MSAKLVEMAIRAFIKLPNGVLDAIFSICYPIYAMTHTNRAWKRVLLHLRRSGFKQSRISVRGVFHSLYLNEIDSLRYLVNDPNNKPEVSYENESVLTNCIKAGMPVVMVGIHQGAFEMQHRALLRYSPRVHLFTQSLKCPVLNQAIRNIRKQAGLDEHDTKDVGAVLKQVIREKSVLALAVDQSKAPKGNEVELFGQKSHLFLRLPIKANQMGAAVVTFRTFWVRGFEHVVRFETAYAPNTPEQELVSGIANEVETWIGEHPHQWTWNYHRNFT